MTNIKNILFDFDGTLVDSAQGIIITMQEVFRRLNIEVPPVEAIRANIGLTLEKGLLQMDINDEQRKAAAEMYASLFQEYELKALAVFPNVKETLSAFKAKGIRMAIATSRDEYSLQHILKIHGLEGFFETRVTATDHLQPKPAPDPVLALLKRMNINDNETLVVGDTIFDILMGNGANCHTCAVTYGNHDRDTLLKVSPTFIIDNFASLKDIVK